VSFLLSALSVCLQAGSIGAAPAAPSSPNASDPVLDVLAAEASRAAAALKSAGDTPLYYLSYRVSDSTHFDIAASYGALVTSDEADEPMNGRSRVLDVSVRVGTPALDNTHKIRGGRFEFDPSDFGMTPALLPIEDDRGALSLAVWTATDQAYKKALKKLVRVRTNKAVKVTEEDDAADFSMEPTQTAIGPRQNGAFDREAWSVRVKRLSALFKGHPGILNSRVSVEGSAWTSYFVDTDGARIRAPQSAFRVMVSGNVKADDGMELNLYRDFEAVTPDQLPHDRELQAAVNELVAQLEALRTAPTTTPYSGPAIITNRAAAVFFHEIFGHRMEGHRQKDADEGHTFTHKVGQQVLPKFVSVVDDPTRDRFGETWLNGHYAYDEEGVPAQRAPLVESGVLRGFLMGRSPIHGFPRSNGHGRAQPGLAVVARQGNLIVSSSKQVPFAELRRQLIGEVKRQGKPYGLVFEDISGGFTQTRADWTPQAFKVLPLVVKRIYPDGRPDELVRGVDLIGTPLQALEKILATGDDPAVFNGFCGAESGFVPVSAVAPSLLVGEIEVERHKPDHDRPPLLPPPLHLSAAVPGGN
jgi:TldD protein